MQIVFAGKAHPADDVGKEIIRQIVQFAHDPQVRHRIAFVEDYDIALARVLLPRVRRLVRTTPVDHSKRAGPVARRRR